MYSVRTPAMAGLFYPAEPASLTAMLQDLLHHAPAAESTPPKALIAPHAGYIYSGKVAAAAYASLAAAYEKIHKVILLGPTHRVAFEGLAAPTAQAFLTPLGEIKIDQVLREKVLRLAYVKFFDIAHAQEHSLEVQLPFLQTVLKDFTLLPLVVGNADAEQVAAVLEAVWGGPETLIVVSSDLSHYLEYREAQAADAATSAAIHDGVAELCPEHACGCLPLNGLLTAAKRHGLRIETLALQNSGDTAGDKRRVVGYGAYGLYAEANAHSPPPA